MQRRLLMSAVAALVCLSSASAAFADLEAPAIEKGASGHAKQVITITAGATGAPEGFTIYWMPRAAFDANGGVWPVNMTGVSFSTFTTAPTLNTFYGEVTTYKLAPFQSAMVEIGDLADESGLLTNNALELTYGTDYVYTVIAFGSLLQGITLDAQTTTVQNCTYTQGYWKNHPEAWPTNTLTLGTVVYNQTELLAILGQEVNGNGLVSLAHQLIAAKLNILNGADPTAASATIAAADAQIGNLVVPPVGSGYLDPSTTSANTQTLDDYNNGVIGPGHCGTTPTEPTTWGNIKSLFGRP